MGELWLPSVPHDPTSYPTGVSIYPSGPLGHRTIGTWNGDYYVLTRALVPSVHFLIGQDEGEWVQFMSCLMAAYGAAGANMRKIHFEFSGQNGESLTDWQIRAGTVALRDLYDAMGWDPAIPYYTGGPAVEERIWIDQNDPVVGLNHAGVDYPPDRSYNHYDFVDEMQSMINAMHGAPSPVPVPVPPPPPDPNEGDDDEMAGPKQAKWKLPDGAEVVDRLKVDSNGNLWTRWPKGVNSDGVDVYGEYPIAGPASQLAQYDGPDPLRYAGKIDPMSRIEITKTDKALRFEVGTVDGSGIVEGFYDPADPTPPTKENGSKWRSRFLLLK